MYRDLWGLERLQNHLVSSLAGLSLSADIMLPKTAHPRSQANAPSIGRHTAASPATQQHIQYRQRQNHIIHSLIGYTDYMAKVIVTIQCQQIEIN